MADDRDASPIATLRDGTEVAAWMFKANPDVWDVLGFLRSGLEVDGWRMAHSYRVDLVAPGQSCVLWITGPKGSAHTPGVWAIGEITGEPYEDVGDPDDHRWRDHGAQRQVRPWVETRMAPLAEPVSRFDLAADPRFATAEILERPRMGSPLALTRSEMEAIACRAGSSGRRVGR